MPTQEDVMRVYHDLRELAERDRKYGTANQELNRQVSMYSRILVARETTAAPDESVRDRVAVSRPIYRAYISSCWNCNYCWNEVYDCRGASILAVRKQNRIRGSDVTVDLNKIAKEYFTYG